MDRFTFLRTNTHRKSLYWNIKYLFVYVQFLVYMNHYISIVFFSSVLHTLCVSGSFELGILCYCCCDSHKNPCFLFLHGYTYGFLYFLGSIFFCNHPITSVANIQLQHVCVCAKHPIFICAIFLGSQYDSSACIQKLDAYCVRSFFLLLFIAILQTTFYHNSIPLDFWIDTFAEPELLHLYKLLHVVVESLDDHYLLFQPGWIKRYQ